MSQSSADTFDRSSQRLRDEIARDLTDEHGGVTWWSSSLEKDERGLLTSYLLSLVSSANQSIGDAQFSIREFKSSSRSWNHTANLAINSGNKFGVPPLQAISGNSTLSRLATLMRMNLERTLISLAQGQDRVAAIALVVSSHEIKRNGILRAAWDTYEKASVEESATTSDPDVTVALSELLDIPSRVEEHGPEDWLRWMRETRNSQTHRARAMSPTLTTSKGGLPHFVHQIFWKDPAKYYLQSLAARDNPQKKKSQNFSDLLIVRDPAVVLEGLHQSTCSLLSQVLNGCSDLWVRRRNAPNCMRS